MFISYAVASHEMLCLCIQRYISNCTVFQQDAPSIPSVQQTAAAKSRGGWWPWNGAGATFSEQQLNNKHIFANKCQSQVRQYLRSTRRSRWRNPIPLRTIQF